VEASKANCITLTGSNTPPPTLRPKVFEVWLGLDYTPPAAPE